MKILYENGDLIVVVKPAGALSEESGNKRSVPLLLKEYYAERNEKNAAVFTVHRLDRDVGGVMAFAKNSRTASELSEVIARHGAEKEYLAVLLGAPEKEEDTLTDLLFRDAASGKTYIADRMRRGVRAAKLSYRLLEKTEYEERTLSLVKVRLFTGRTHQIRVQFASRKLPLFGDGRYGGGECGKMPALFSCRLAFPGLFDCAAAPEDFPFTLFESCAQKQTEEQS